MQKFSQKQIDAQARQSRKEVKIWQESFEAAKKTVGPRYYMPPVWFNDFIVYYKEARKDALVAYMAKRETFNEQERIYEEAHAIHQEGDLQRPTVSMEMFEGDELTDFLFLRLLTIIIGTMNSKMFVANDMDDRCDMTTKIILRAFDKLGSYDTNISTNAYGYFSSLAINTGRNYMRDKRYAQYKALDFACMVKELGQYGGKRDLTYDPGDTARHGVVQKAFKEIKWVVTGREGVGHFEPRDKRFKKNFEAWKRSFCDRMFGGIITRVAWLSPLFDDGMPSNFKKESFKEIGEIKEGRNPQPPTRESLEESIRKGVIALANVTDAKPNHNLGNGGLKLTNAREGYGGEQVTPEYQRAKYEEKHGIGEFAPKAEERRIKKEIKETKQLLKAIEPKKDHPNKNTEQPEWRKQQISETMQDNNSRRFLFHYLDKNGKPVKKYKPFTGTITRLFNEHRECFGKHDRSALSKLVKSMNTTHNVKGWYVIREI